MVSKSDPNYDPNVSQSEAEQVIKLTRNKYNNEIGLLYMQRTSNRRMQQQHYKAALLQMSENLLKGVSQQHFNARYLKTMAGYQVLKGWYSS